MAEASDTTAQIRLQTHEENEALIILENKSVSVLTDILNKFWQTGIMPVQWKYGDHRHTQSSQKDTIGEPPTNILDIVPKEIIGTHSPGPAPCLQAQKRPLPLIDNGLQGQVCTQDIKLQLMHEIIKRISRYRTGDIIAY